LGRRGDHTARPATGRAWLAANVVDRHYHPPMHDDDPQWLYEIRGRFWFSRPLWIGVTNSVPRRMGEHQRDKDWFAESRRISYKPFPDRPTVLTAEARAIRRKHPVYNKQHNTRVEVSAEVELSGNGVAAMLAMVFGAAMLVKWGSDVYAVRRTRTLAELQGIEQESPKVPCPFTEERPGTLGKLFWTTMALAYAPPPPPIVLDDPESHAAFLAWQKSMDPIAVLWARPSEN
jgi:hypothetical protein